MQWLLLLLTMREQNGNVWPMRHSLSMPKSTPILSLKMFVRQTHTFLLHQIKGLGDRSLLPPSERELCLAIRLCGLKAELSTA